MFALDLDDVESPPPPKLVRTQQSMMDAIAEEEDKVKEATKKRNALLQMDIDQVKWPKFLSQEITRNA